MSNNRYYEILQSSLEPVDGIFHERVHTPVTRDTKQVAFNYYFGSADMKKYTADMHAIVFEEKEFALISLRDFRKVGKHKREVGPPITVGALSFKGFEPLPEPTERLDGYLLAIHGDGPIRLSGLTRDTRLVDIEGVHSGFMGDVTVAFLSAISEHVARKVREELVGSH